MNSIIETDRLLLRLFTLDDAPLIFQLNLDPEVTRFTGDPIINMEEAERVLQQIIIPQYALYNHGRWAVHVKHDLEFIGWCGLKTKPATGLGGSEGMEIDLGYRLLKKAWGKGYATEAAYACIKYGFEKLNLPRIIGRAMPQNTGSIRVLEKCDMRYLGEEVVDGHPARTYESINPFILQ